MTNYNYWKRGEKALLARKSGLSPSHLSDILHKRKGVSPTRALQLERLCKRHFKKTIPFKAWVFNKTSNHAAFNN